ncbi:MAG TPA: acyl-[ACP]--phospholipid O-acyltransferase [Candidatus Binatia bacterium]|nr:acyl-[ACP]--phospholipid O-acyltransferase [Candidatus Binatia bacterium]
MATGKYIDILKDRGFFCFFWTQFLGAFNDNFYKIIVSFVAIDRVAASGSRSLYLSLIAFLFVLPSGLFSAYAGQLADRYSKRHVLVAVKIFEIVVMALGLYAFFLERIEPMLIIVFLMGLHAAFFSPAKYGILPEMLPDKDLSRSNGLLEMSTFLAIILGTSLGGVIFTIWKGRLELIGLLLVLIAIVGTLTSIGITKVPPSGATKPFNPNPWTEIWAGLNRLYGDKELWLTVVGISFFWFLGVLVQTDVLLFGKEILQLDEAHIGLLGTFLAVGIGIGSLAAGRLSGDKIELGLVPLGSAAIGLSAVVIFLSMSSHALVAAGLIVLGVSAGLFIVPLNALLQQRSGKEEKGKLIASNNFLNTVGMLLAAATLWAMSDVLGIRSDYIMLIVGLLTFAATAYVLYLLPDFFVRFILWVLTHSLYRIRIVGQENIPVHGPALLVSNHVSFVDALLIGASVPRFIRFMLHREYYDIRWLNWLFRLMKSIPISATNRRDIVHALQSARKELEQGQVVCIFAEGAISRIGHLLPFKRGFEKVVEGTSFPIIPVHLDQLWGSIFSFKEGRFFWKRPKLLPYPVTVSFGAPLPPTASVQEVRQAVLELESQAFEYRRATHGLLHARFIRTAKRHWSSLCMADTTGTELSFGKALIGGMLLSRWLRKHATNDSMVGILLPASAGGALANIAVFLAGKVPVNLNFTSGQEAMVAAIRQCEIKTILTSRVFLSKANVSEMPGMVFLEEIRQTFTSIQKLLALLSAFLFPSRILEHHYSKNQKSQDLATVIFSSGSTGTPKGVMLSHHNILTNIESVCQVIHFSPNDRIMGVLPFFHSFGFSISLWLPLIVGFAAVYHPNPMDAKTIGETVQKYRATFLISTPTFYAGYMRRCTVDEFASLRYAVAGAEKLREQIRKGFKDQYALDLLEGYGCTELAPVVSVNLPDVLDAPEPQTGYKPGTVGHPIPGVAVKVVDPDTGQSLSAGQEGLLVAKGANVMLGYLGEPELTNQVLRDGWYITGDIASLDEDGFITITDRISRFSKIGGEMVPHMKIEEVVNTILGEAASVVTALPDEQKGEKLVAFYTRNGMSVDELWDRLNRSDLPKLWIPKRENIHCIDSIPLLGSGKVDLKKVKRLAAEKADNKS